MMAFCTRFVASRSSSTGSPATVRGSSSDSSETLCSAANSAEDRSTEPTTSSSRSGVRLVSPRSLRASTKRPSIIRSLRSLVCSRCSPSRRTSGFIRVRHDHFDQRALHGVRSSCDALDSAVPMAKRIGPVTAATATGKTGKTARRTDKIPSDETSGLGGLRGHAQPLGVLGGKVRSGALLGPATQNYPTVVLGSVAAASLGIDHVAPAKPPQVWICGQWFTVIGVLGPMPLAPEIERSVLVGWNAASEYLGFDGHPTTVYARADESEVDNVRQVLGRTLNPQAPNEVAVRRPSAAPAAQKVTDNTYRALFLGLGAVALLVGGVGVANTMVISVLERHREIGLRARGDEASGARTVPGRIRAAVRARWGVRGARRRGRDIRVRLESGLAGGAAAGRSGRRGRRVRARRCGGWGAYPAVRAVRLPPTQALA
jgi:putative ABC transport system permease protein